MLRFSIGFIRVNAWPLALIVCVVALAHYLLNTPNLFPNISRLGGNDGVLSGLGKYFEKHSRFLPLVLATGALWLRSSAALWFLAVAVLSNLPTLTFVFEIWAKGRVAWDAPKILWRTALPLGALVLCVVAVFGTGRKPALLGPNSILDRRLKTAAIVASGIALIACLSLVPGVVRDDTPFAKAVQLKLLSQPELPVLFLAFLAAIYDMKVAPWLHGLALLYLLNDIQQNLQYLLYQGRNFINGEVELTYAAASVVALVCASFFARRNKRRSETE
ncbi:hypothetical protein [Actibacterium lipolyticum]|uniref:Uncharacterized protein n=1 Tax=Actibacterium lipolyticum TaxID=1524263 RepID=A0A238KFT1_9RHOB|nr:hypothetical protein [Actibacterium lipolyticum]SMX41719.1 hypothetical protein COL8621_01812 [Actibacterium lipolyticum]